MAQREAPSAMPRNQRFVAAETGYLTQAGLMYLHGMWRQIAAGHAAVPCQVTQVSVNALVLTPRLHEEGAAAYGDHMMFIGVAAATSTGAVTARVGALAAVKVYIDGGASQAGAGDIVSGRLYLFIYSAALDGGAGGLVLK